MRLNGIYLELETPPQITVSTRTSHGLTTFSVHDNGPGASFIVEDCQLAKLSRAAAAFNAIMSEPVAQAAK
jgi:hypothetical protein